MKLMKMRMMTTSTMAIRHQRHGLEALAHSHVLSRLFPSPPWLLHKNPMPPSSLFSLTSQVCPVFRSPNSWHPARKLGRPKWQNTRSSFKALWVKITKTDWTCLVPWMRTLLCLQNTAHPLLNSPPPACLHQAVIPPPSGKVHLPPGGTCLHEGTLHAAIYHQGERHLHLGISPLSGMYIEEICHPGGTFLLEGISPPSHRRDGQHPQEGISREGSLPEVVTGACSDLCPPGGVFIIQLVHGHPAPVHMQR